MSDDRTKAMDAVRATFDEWKAAQKSVRLTKMPEALDRARARCAAAEKAYRAASTNRDEVFGRIL